MDPLFSDLGTNLGMFALAVASMGREVYQPTFLLLATFVSAFPESEATYSYVLHIPKVRETITIKIIGILVSNEKKWFSKYDTIGF